MALELIDIGINLAHKSFRGDRAEVIARARAAGVQRLRVDCYGGGTGALVRFYESCGYERLSTFDVDGWPGQLLGRNL